METLILILSISTNSPSTPFLGYADPRTPNTPTWEVSPNVCHTASLQFTSEPGEYEIWWRHTLQPNNEPIRINDLIVVKEAGETITKFAVLPNEMGFFFLKKH